LVLSCGKSASKVPLSIATFTEPSGTLLICKIVNVIHQINKDLHLMPSTPQKLM
jgi:hypothetical protein